MTRRLGVVRVDGGWCVVDLDSGKLTGHPTYERAWSAALLHNQGEEDARRRRFAPKWPAVRR